MRMQDLRDLARAKDNTMMAVTFACWIEYEELQGTTFIDTAENLLSELKELFAEAGIADSDVEVYEMAKMCTAEEFAKNQNMFFEDLLIGMLPAEYMLA